VLQTSDKVKLAGWLAGRASPHRMLLRFQSSGLAGGQQDTSVGVRAALTGQWQRRWVVRCAHCRYRDPAVVVVWEVVDACRVVACTRSKQWKGKVWTRRVSNQSQ